MADMTLIATVLTSLKAATDLTKLLKEVDSSFSASEWKLKLAGITDSLAEAKLTLAEIKDVIIEKDEKIKQLQEALENKAKVIKIRDAYYEVDSEGEPIGDPYCLNCWESKHVLRHLMHSQSNRRTKQCPSCKTAYDGWNIRTGE